MKKMFIALCLCAISACGQPEVMPPLVCSVVTTSLVAVTATGTALSAYVKAFQVSVTPAGGTCTVSISTIGALASRTLYSGSCVGTAMVYEVVQYSTNGVAVGSYDYPMLANEALVVSASTATVSNDVLTVTVKPIVDRMR